MEPVGLRELRQDASALVRRVENGETFEITVAGRPAARLVPLPRTPRRWNTWDDIAHVFDESADAAWPLDRELVDQSLVNPWDRET